MYLCAVIFFGWILFKFTSLNDVALALKGMFGLNGNKFIDFESGAIIKSNAFILILCAVFTTPFAKRVGELFKYGLIYKRWAQVTFAVGKIALPLVLLLLSTAALIGDTYNPFLYFRF